MAYLHRIVFRIMEQSFKAYAVQELMSVYDDVEVINFRPNFPERVKRKIEKKVMGSTFLIVKLKYKGLR